MDIADGLTDKCLQVTGCLACHSNNSVNVL